jgi:predicted AAA+ superfamily ATPase
MDKIFFWDVGVRNAVIDNFKLPELRDDVGRLWENFIISERLKFLSNHQQYARSYFWRTYTGAELDYVEESNGDLHGYKIKWQKTKSRIPPSWAQAYPDASFHTISRENYFDFISRKEDFVSPNHSLQ